MAKGEKYDGGPAFATDTRPGMTMRDYFAGQALAGLLARLGGIEGDENMAALAYEYADAMLKERNK